MRAVAVTLALTLALCACAPSGGPEPRAGAAPEAGQAPAPDALLGQIAGNWRSADTGALAQGFGTAMIETGANGALFELGSAPDGSRSAIRMPLTQSGEWLYRIDWADERADAGRFPGNVEILCGAGGENMPFFLRFARSGGELVTRLYKIDADHDRPRSEPCLTLRWQR